MAELADALRSGRSVRKDVKVQILSLVPVFRQNKARVAELADALRSGRSVRKDVKVQILSLVPDLHRCRPVRDGFFVKASMEYSLCPTQ